MADLVRSTLDHGVALVTLDNPPLNLVTLELTRRLEETLDRLAGEPACRVLVLTGAGERAFCAGSDVREFPELVAPGRAVAVKMARENRVFSKLADFPKPTIAALRGLAFGGGLELAVACDLLLAEEGTRLALPEINLGVFPGAGGTVRVTRRIGEGRAKAMMFTGEPIDAATACEWGLVNRVVAKGRVVEEAMALARSLAAKPATALRLCKQAIDLAFDATEKDAIERALAPIGRAFEGEELRKGVAASREKRPPRCGRGGLDGRSRRAHMAGASRRFGMSEPVATPVHVVRPDEGESFWQPVPANGWVEVRISHRRDPRVTCLASGIQVIAPASYIREHVHPAQDELLFFYKGTGEAWIDGERHELVPGTTVFVGAGHRHKFVNTGDGPLEMLWVMLPGGENGLDDFFARIGRPRTPGEPAPAPFPRPADVLAIETGTVFAPMRCDDGPAP